MTLRELVVQRVPGRDPLLGCAAARRFLEVDEDTLRAVEALRSSFTVGDAEAALHRELGEEVDVVALASRLAECGFVESVDGLPCGALPPRSRIVRLLESIPPEKLQWLHHPALVVGLFGLLFGGLGAALSAPAVIPGYRDLLLLGRPSTILVGTFAGLLACAFLHELAHFFTARSFGISASLRLTHRYYLLVLETDVTNAWVLPDRQRLAIFLSGIAFNLAVVSACLMAQVTILADPGQTYLSALPALRVVAFLNFFPLFFQLFVFARTDLYYVLMLAAGERNLAGDARAYLNFRLQRVWLRLRRTPGASCPTCASLTFPEDPFCLGCGAARRVPDPNRWPFQARQRGRLAWFGVAFVLGQALGYAYMLTVGLGFTVAYVEIAAVFLQRALAAGDAFAVAEGVAVMLAAALPVGAMAYFLARGAAGHVRTAARWARSSEPFDAGRGAAPASGLAASTNGDLRPPSGG